MVALSGRGWNLPPSLKAMVSEANRIAPRRSKHSDGSIGNAAHAARTSDHNVYGGWVHAVDLTHDPKGGFDAHAYARKVAARKDPRIAYIISNGQIWHHSTGKWTKYTKANKHTTHAHFSIKKTPEARADTRSWFGNEASVPNIPPPTVPPTPVEEVERPQINIKFKQGENMKLYRDHNGSIWIWYSDDTRAHIASSDEVKIWKDFYKLDYLDFGPGALFYNPILSQAWLNRIPVRS